MNTRQDKSFLSDQIEKAKSSFEKQENWLKANRYDGSDSSKTPKVEVKKKVECL